MLVEDTTMSQNATYDSKKWDNFHSNAHIKAAEKPPSSYAIAKEKLFPRNSLVVDVGGGTGADVNYFLQQGHSAILIDISPFALKTAQNIAKEKGQDKGLAVKHVDLGLNNIPIHDNSVDIVYSRIALNYFGVDRTAQLVHDIYRILKPGGKAFLTLRSSADTEEFEYFKENATEYEPEVFIENGQLFSRFSLESLKYILSHLNIPNCEVNPITEEPHPEHKKEHERIYMNEITFAK
jgi:ubiquinone/menaquinone biosynthesis C-methylase UbiE